ncbi:MAG: sulfotransferase domain-containing protein [Bacteroidota bacterium]
MRKRSFKDYKRIGNQLSKAVNATFRPTVDKRRILLIVGCQRSGTSMLRAVFGKDPMTKIFAEKSVLSSDDKIYNIRLNAINKLNEQLESYNYPLLVLKPLVESQYTTSLLDEIPNSKAIWLYRHYVGVAYSNLKKFGMQNSINNLRPIAKGEMDNWRSENLAPETVALVKKYFSEDMNPYDGAALFWYVRNSLFFQQELQDNEKVMLLNYEDLTTQPEKKVQSVYNFMQFPYPNKAIAGLIHENKKAKLLDRSVFSPVITELCEAMFQQLKHQELLIQTKQYHDAK